MAEGERRIISDRLRNLEIGERIFRINAGTGWTGSEIRIDSRRNLATIRNPRPLRAAPPGWPDLCGWTSVIVTPDMVGQTVAVATFEEVKAGADSHSREQREFRKIAEKMGCIYRVLRDNKENKNGK